MKYKSNRHSKFSQLLSHHMNLPPKSVSATAARLHANKDSKSIEHHAPLLLSSSSYALVPRSDWVARWTQRHSEAGSAKFAPKDPNYAL
ncbi:hypothetical protein PROFUN_05201 [Planoprotostelium fungivorum]|uniref:Uncharacterized protein n=1 Tax=Planoprotostelium fungivorum TaxID=1890364 RepID=A0A2P6NRH5_9EUKA|nr:hypothetical protein PROFUN_05201 [Planoprotostelium fungivorum]